MIRLKNKKAFSLIEVLVALAIVGITLGPIYFVQGSIFRTIVKMSNAVSRMLVAYTFFVSIEPDQKDVTKDIDDPKTKLVCHTKELPQESTLAQQFNHLSYKKCTWSWTILGSAYSNSFVSIHFNPPKKKEQQELNSVPQDASKAQTANKNNSNLPVIASKGGLA